MKLILASKSPRRREILSGLGVGFEIVTRDTDETCALTDPAALVEELARRKGEAVWETLSEDVREDAIVLSADTVVALDGKILGKPHSPEQGEEMLRLLSGRTHSVLSGYQLIGKGADGRTLSFVGHETTGVSFAPIDEADLRAYLETSEPYDKAGGYAIQGHAALWIRSIEGCYYNVVGLPVFAVAQALERTFGIKLTDFGTGTGNAGDAGLA